MIQVIFPLTLMLVFFALFYKFGISFSKLVGRRVCITCYSVSLTWFTLLVLKYLGIYDFSKYLIAILISQSVVGISNLSDDFLLINNLRIPITIMKFGTILYGTFAVLSYAFISEALGLILVVPLMTVGVLSMNPVTKEPFSSSTKSKELLEKLKHCCG
jgi:hypothetical protein